MKRFFRRCLPCVTLCLASSAIADVTYDFNANGQAFATEFISAPFDGPWVYASAIGAGATGGWSTSGQSAEAGHPCTVDLVSPAFTVAKAGVVRLSFDHRFNFEYDGTRWDGGAVYISINGGPSTIVPVTAFVTGGYDNKIAANSQSALKSQMAFTAKSTGYDVGAFIKSIANLGSLNAGDTVRVRFRFAGDTNTTGGVPTWAIDNVSLAEGFAGAALTYQGVLRDGGAPISGPVDLRFSLYGSATSAAAADLISGPVAMNGVAVGAGGIITVPVDFGAGAFDDRAKWIEVEVKQSGGYVRISPRMAVTPTPTAVFATNAANVPWSGISGAPTDLAVWGSVPGGIQYSGGNVGVGTNTPDATLHVTSANSIDQLKVSAAAAAPFGAFLSLDATATAGGHEWVMFSSGGTAAEGGGKLVFRNLNTSAYGIITDENGRVGIGTSTPGFRLHVAGADALAAQIQSTSTIGTWLNLFSNSAGGAYWRMISTGPGNAEGAGKLLIGFGAAQNLQSTVMTMQQNGNVGIGTTAPTQKLTVAGNVLANNVAVPSSIRFKDHVAPMDDALDSLLKLEGVRFDWKPEWAQERPGREHDIGFVAEDVAKVFPEVVFRDEQGNVTGMDYSRLTAVAIQAIKQQQARFDAALAKRDGENAELRARLEKLENLIAQQGASRGR